VVYGMLALVATLPGAVVLVLARRRTRDSTPGPTEAPARIASALNT